jgi:VanZ family protein
MSAPALRYMKAWLAVGLLIAVAITITSLVPARDLPALGISDKLEHVIAYLLLAFSFASVIPWIDHPYLMLALLAFGGGLEIAQGLMGLGREMDLMDFLADAAGIVVGNALALTPLGRWARLIEAYLMRRTS